MSTIYDPTTGTTAEIEGAECAGLTTDPAGPSLTGKPWYKNWITWLVAGAIFVSAIVAAGLIFLQSPHNASSIVSHDGYTTVQAGADEMKKSMGTEAQAYFGDDVAVGIKGTKAEAAVELNASGKAMMPIVLPMLSSAGPGISGHIDGNYLVISGPASSFANASK